jgi:hypothetical protein
MKFGFQKRNVHPQNASFYLISTNFVKILRVKASNLQNLI